MLKGLEGEILEMVLLAIVLCCILIGSNRGLVVGLYGMIKNIIIIAAAIGAASVVAKRLPETLVAREGIAYAICFAVSIIVFNIVGRLIKVANDIPMVSGLNRLGGALFGLITGFFVVWSLLTLLGVFQEYDWCSSIVSSARKNNVVMWFQGCNPLPAILKMFDFPVI